jgi:hypothetical protein
MTRQKADGRRQNARGVAVVAVTLLLGLVAGSRAQERSDVPKAETGAESAAPSDPRVGLRAGFHGAGVAALGMELVASLPRPAGFYDPKAPFGIPIRSAPDDKEVDTGGALSFANSDLAFAGEHLFMGNFHGFSIYNIEDPARARLVASVVCPGGQNDVSIHGDLLVVSVEETRGRLDCGTEGVMGRASPERFRGVRLFDVSDLRRPRQVAAVQTCRGSHTHALVPNPADAGSLYIYSSGTAAVRPAEELPECSGTDPKEDPDTALFSIDVIHVPLAAPEEARIVSRPRIFADLDTGAIAGLWPGGDHGPGTQRTSVTDRCHDITVYPDRGLAAGACAGNGLLLDIRDPVNPVRIDHVTDPNFAYWHSATFNHDATKVIFTDEWGGGTRPRCRPDDPPAWGANAIFDIVDGRLRFGSYYKLPAPQTEQENCVAHNGSIVPVPGRDILVQAWYQGGVSVFDFTDSTAPFEIAYFDRGPIDARNLVVGGHWSAYWYNGLIYASEMARGLDIFRLTPGEHRSAHEIEAASLVRADVFNAQQQTRIVWPSSPVVARAYLDQLARTDAVAPDQAQAISGALARVEELRAPRAPDAALQQELVRLASLLEREGGGATDVTAVRLTSLAATLRDLANAPR